MNWFSTPSEARYERVSQGIAELLLEVFKRGAPAALVATLTDWACEEMEQTPALGEAS